MITTLFMAPREEREEPPEMSETVAESSAAAARRPPPSQPSSPPRQESPSPMRTSNPPPSLPPIQERPDSPSSHDSLAFSMPGSPLGPDDVPHEPFRHAILPVRSRTPSQPPTTPLGPSSQNNTTENSEDEEFVPPSRSPPNLEGRPSSYQQLVAYSLGDDSQSKSPQSSEGSERPGSVHSHSSAASLSNGMRSVSVRGQARRTAADRSRQIHQHPLTRQLLEDGDESDGQEGS